VRLSHHSRFYGTDAFPMQRAWPQMNFLHCRECGNLRPRGWIIFTKRCENCHNDMDKIKVEMTRVAPFYYASLVATMVVLVMYLSGWALPLGSLSVLILMGLTIVLAFIDYSMSYSRVKEMLNKQLGAKKA